MKEYQALLKLQEVDIQLMRYNQQLHTLLEGKRIPACTTALKKLKQQQTQLLAQRKDIETELQDNLDMQTHLQEITQKVKLEAQAAGSDYRRISDLELQLSSLAKKFEKLQFDEKKLKADLEKFKKAEHNAHLLQEKLHGELASLKDEQAQSIEDIKRQAASLLHVRDEVKCSVSHEHTALYTSLKSRFNGICVEELKGNMPSVCCVKLQPSLYNKIKADQTIAECPYCHRLLIIASHDRL